MKTLPHITISSAPPGWKAADMAAWDWTDVTRLPPLIRADGRGPARQQTRVRLGYDATALYVRFDCEDEDIWGTFTERDDPIYDEEVVEVFLAPGRATPAEYAEIEVSPNGVLFDAWIHNPTGDRADMTADTSWDCAGIRWRAQRLDAEKRWWAVMVLPWAAVAPAGPLLHTWRANFYRIERPRGRAPEFSCWSPTLTDPADFHKPDRFGVLELGG